MKKPGTKLWKAQAVNNRENTWERRYYNGVGSLGKLGRERPQKALRREVTQRGSSQAHLRKIQKDAKILSVAGTPTCAAGIGISNNRTRNIE
jgi:hypothetical protein